MSDGQAKSNEAVTPESAAPTVVPSSAASDAWLRERLDDLEVAVNETRRRTLLNVEQIDALQVDASKKRRWFKDPPVLIALIAVLVSVAGTIFTRMDVSAQSGVQNQNRFTTVVNTLAEIDRRNREAIRNNPTQPMQANTDSLLLANEAVTLLPQTKQSVSELMVVARALAVNGNLSKAKGLVERGRVQASSLNDRAIVFAVGGQTAFGAGDLTTGRNEYSALESLIASSESNQQPVARTLGLAIAHWDWGMAELYAHQCDQARSHFDIARSKLDSIPAVPQVVQMRAQLGSARDQLAASCR